MMVLGPPTRSLRKVIMDDPLAPLPAAYRVQLTGLLGRAAGDARIRAVWLSGSLARGTADAGSDLDLIITVTDDALPAIRSRWREWWDGLIETVSSRVLDGAGLVIVGLTEDLCRVDAVVEAVSSPVAADRPRAVVLDHDGLAAVLPAPAPPRLSSMDPDEMAAGIGEFWRILAIAPAMIDGRGDLLCAHLGTQLAWRHLVDLLVAAHGPHPVTGAKYVESRLPGPVAATLRTLPPIVAERPALITASLALAETMSTLGRTAARRCGAAYPDRLDHAVTAGLHALVADERVGREPIGS